MGLEEGVLLARGALSTLNREKRHWMDELRKTCQAIQSRNVQILSNASSDDFSSGLEPLVKQQQHILDRLKEISPQIADLQITAWGKQQGPNHE